MGTAIIVCGSPGSGKSTIGRRLAAKRKGTLLDLDTVTGRLVRVSLVEAGRDGDDRDSDYFKRVYRQPIYEALFDIARENLPWQDVVIVGPFTRERSDSHWPVRLAEHLGFPVEIHYVYCPPHVRKQRLESRSNARDGAKLKDWESFLEISGEEHPPEFPHVYVDNS